MKTLLLIDGNAIMHRAYYALPPFKTKNGIPTNAIYGFFSMLYKAITDFNTQYLIVAFDTPKKTFREKLFKKYQAQRPKISDDFKAQIPYIRDLIDKAGITRLEKDGYEADDVIGTVAAYYKDHGIRTFILTGDKDIFQLVNDNVFVISPQKGLSSINVYNEEEVEKKMGVKPQSIPDLKALSGDSSDNYKGAKGIGPKTATTLLEQFGSIENLLKNIDKIEDVRIKEIVTSQKENISLTKKISKIVTDVDIDIDLEKTEFHGFDPQLKEALKELELYSLVKRFFEANKSLENKPREEKPKKNQNNKDQMGLF